MILNLSGNIPSSGLDDDSRDHRSVFISHARANFDIADEVRRLLEERGVKCWIAPRDIPASSSYGEEISKAIDDCAVTVLVLTEQSNASRPVANEIELSFSRQKTIVPLRLREVKPSKLLEFYVANAQWIDAYYSPLKHRVDEIVSIIHAVEHGKQIPSPKPEKKTILGRINRALEQTLRHKTLAALILFLVFGGLGGVTAVNTFKLQSAAAVDRNAVEQDPLTLGLIKLSAATRADTDSKGEGVPLGASIYLNVRGATFQDVEIAASLENSTSKISIINISKHLMSQNGVDVQMITFRVPNNTKRVTMCMTAKHPTLNVTYTAVWPYLVNLNGTSISVVRDQPPSMHAGTYKACTE